jgi:hypothetical protein
MIDEAGRLLFLMLAGHAFADFAIQTEYTSRAKRPGGSANVPWQMALLYHSLIHGGIVALVTGYWLLGVAETIAHMWLDYGKGREWISARTDQLAHIACKIVWAFIALYV